MTDKTLLDPCPFCGSGNLTQGILGSRARTVVCGCGASLTSLIEPGNTFIEPAWNSRVESEKYKELHAAASDILLSFTANTECRIPHHQVERLFKAVHGQDAKTPWDE